MRRLLVTMSLLAIAGCSSRVPDSGAGAGFDNYAIYEARREAALAGETASPVPTGQPLSAETVTGAPAPAAVATPPRASAAISDEQDFGAVAERETIESDAARLAQVRAQYEVVQPTDLPTREGGGGPSIVAFALSSSNLVGEKLYKRSTFLAERRFNRNCTNYGSADQAQEDFLRRGGPARDTKGLDPDGDGFACYWDPTPFRQARSAD